MELQYNLEKKKIKLLVETKMEGVLIGKHEHMGKKSNKTLIHGKNTTSNN